MSKTAAPDFSLREGAVRGLRYALEQVPYDPATGCWTVVLLIRLWQAISHFVRVAAWVWQVRCQLSCVVVHRWSRTEISTAL